MGEPLDAERRAELLSLRARAYGASADIRSDPVALRRLEHLERRMQQSALADATPDGAAETPPGPADGAGIVAAPAPAPTALERAAPSIGPPVAAGGPRRRRRSGLLWLFSIALTAGLAVGATLAVTGLPSPEQGGVPRGAHRIAVLDVDPGFVAGAAFLGGDTRGFTPFEGMTAISTTAGLGADDGVPCLVVVATGDYDPAAGTIEGTVSSGCRAKEFPASAQFVVNAASPAALQERFGVGRGIRFVLEDGRVSVYVVG